jgi:nucleoside-diphosphate-sugar epimerase
VADDEPAPLSEWASAFARAVGAKEPRRVPVWLARLVAGSAAAEMTTAQRGASNAKAKCELGWQPRHPSRREAFADPAARG